MDFDTIIKKRKSAHSFSNKKASWKKVLDAIDAGLQGPFAGNHNHLRFIIIEEQELIDQIASLSNQSWLNSASLIVAVCSDDSKLENLYGDRGRVYSRQQAGATIETIILKLTELGLDSCWIGEYPDSKIRKLLNVPGKVQIEALIPVGYDNSKATKKRKLKLENVLFWEQWGTTDRPTIFKDPEIVHDYRPIDN
jgi:nitroreductase